MRRLKERHIGHVMKGVRSKAQEPSSVASWTHPEEARFLHSLCVMG